MGSHYVNKLALNYNINLKKAQPTPFNCVKFCKINSVPEFHFYPYSVVGEIIFTLS